MQNFRLPLCGFLSSLTLCSLSTLCFFSRYLRLSVLVRLSVAVTNAREKQLKKNLFWISPKVSKVSVLCGGAE
jgi:hypothetical protein